MPIFVLVLGSAANECAIGLLVALSRYNTRHVSQGVSLSRDCVRLVGACGIAYLIAAGLELLSSFGGVDTENRATYLARAISTVMNGFVYSALLAILPVITHRLALRRTQKLSPPPDQ